MCEISVARDCRRHVADTRAGRSASHGDSAQQLTGATVGNGSIGPHPCNHGRRGGIDRIKEAVWITRGDAGIVDLENNQLGVLVADNVLEEVQAALVKRASHIGHNHRPRFLRDSRGRGKCGTQQ